MPRICLTSAYQETKEKSTNMVKWICTSRFMVVFRGDKGNEDHPINVFFIDKRNNHWLFSTTNRKKTLWFGILRESLHLEFDLSKKS